LDDDDSKDAKKNKYAGLSSGQIKILKQKEYEEKLIKIADEVVKKQKND
jgi:hypothetical protein